MSYEPSAEQSARTRARHELVRLAQGTVPALPPAPELASELVALALELRMSAVVADYVRQVPGAFSADDRTRLMTAEQRAALDGVRFDALALHVTDVLASAAVPHAFFKGIALAHGVYPTPVAREFGDLDLVVADGHFVRAIDALTRAGAARPIPERRRGFDRRFAKDVPLLIGNRAIDLHRRVAEGAYGERLPVDELIERATTATIGNREIPVLGVADAYLVAAITAGFGDQPPRFSTLRDLDRLEADRRFDPAAVRALADGYRMAEAVATAMELRITNGWRVTGEVASLLLGIFDDGVRLGRLRARMSDRHIVAALAGLSLAGELPWRLRPALVVGLLAPNRHYRRAVRRLAEHR